MPTPIFATNTPFQEGLEDSISYFEVPEFKSLFGKIQASVASPQADWTTEYTLKEPEILQKPKGLFRNGDVVLIKNPNHKYGHTATYYNGNWYSDFKQGLKMDPYRDSHLSQYAIFRNPNQEEAEKAAAIVASRAKNKSLGKCARGVREGFNIASKGRYLGEGYNGNNIGEYLVKRNWTQIAKNGIKFMEPGGVTPIFATNTPFIAEDIPTSVYLNSYLKIPTFNTFETIYYLKPESNSNSFSWDNYSIKEPTKPTTSIDSTLDKLVKGGYATDPKYASKIKSMINYALTKAGGNNKKFYDTMVLAYMNKGKDANTASVLAAQDALESSWGKKQSGTFNFGGIKGKGTTVATHENVGGKSVATKASFRNFKSPDDYVNYKLDMLSRKYNIT